MKKLIQLMFFYLFPGVRVSALEDENADLRRRLASAEDRLGEVQRRADQHVLTGLPNTYISRERFIGELSALLRSKECPVSVVCAFIDLDGFKSVNDRYGHDKGDEVLRYFGGLLQSYFRLHDIVCHRSGDEFYVMLIDAEREAGISRIESFANIISDDQFMNRLEVTMSVGITARLVVDSDDLKVVHRALLEQADQAMYQAKNAGKNCLWSVTT